MSTSSEGVTPSRQRRKRSDDAAARVLLNPVRASRANAGRSSGADPSKIEKIGSLAPVFEPKKNSFVQKYVQNFIATRARGLTQKLLVREYGHGRKDLAAVLRANPRVEYFGEERAQRRVELVLLNGKNHVPNSTAPLQMDLVIAVDAAREIPSEKLGDWIASIVGSLAPGGAFLLFANKLISRTVYVPESGYMHAVHRALPRDCSLVVTSTTDATFDIYHFSRSKKQTLLYQRVGRKAEPSDISALDARGDAMLVRWVERTSRRLESGAGGDEARIAKLQAELVEERRERQRIENINRLADELEAMSVELSPPDPAPSISRDETLECNADRDSLYAQKWPGWERVAHIGNTQWIGIRGATGYLPGAKYMIPTKRTLDQAEIRELINQIHQKRIETIIIQGYSENMHLTVQALHKTFGAHVRIIAVWHGSTALLHAEHEYALLDNLLRAKSRGFVDKLYCVKPGFSIAYPAFEREVPFNAPPNIQTVTRELRINGAHVLVPLTMYWVKNVHTNVFAACSDPRVRKVTVVGQLQQSIVNRAGGRIELIPWADRAQLFELIRRSDVLMYATLTGCQPMTLLESVAHGVPCITNHLAIPEFDEHPYMRLAGIQCLDNVEHVGGKLSRLLDYGKHSDLRNLALDFSAHVNDCARRSWERLI